MVKRRFNLLKVIIAVCVLALSLSIASAFAVKNKTVSADGSAPSSVTGTLKMVAGVSARLNTVPDESGKLNNGLRYRVMIDAETWTGTILPNKNITLGILIFPTKYITSDTSNIINKYHAAKTETEAEIAAGTSTEAGTYTTFEAQDITVEKGKVYISMINGNQYYCANGVLTNIKTNHRDLEYTAVGYTYNGSTYTYADKNAAKCLHEVLSCLYFWPEESEREDYEDPVTGETVLGYRSLIQTAYNVSSWLGTAEFPYIIDTSKGPDYYSVVVDDVKHNITYSGKYFKITNDLTAPKGTELLGLNGGKLFAGTFTEDSAIVHATQEDSVIANFDYKQSEKRIFAYDGDYTTGSITWSSNYEGENGVVAISVSGAWPYMTFATENPVATYAAAGYTHLKVKMYIPAARGIEYLVLADHGTNRSVELNETFITTDAWVDYYFEIEPFIYWWSEEGTQRKSTARLWTHASAITNTTFYISEITACKWERPTAKTGEVDIFGQAALNDVSFDNEHTPTSIFAAPAEHPDSGTHSAACYTVGSGAKLYLAPRQTIDKYYDYYYINLAVKFVGTGTVNVMFFDGTDYQTNTGASAVATGSWQSLNVRIDKFYGVYDSLVARTVPFFKVTANDSSSLTQINIYEIKGTANASHTAGKLLEVASASTDKFFSRTGGAYMAGSAYIENSTGVTDTTYAYLPVGTYLATLNTGGNAWFNLRSIPTCTFSEFISYDYIKFDIYIYNHDNTTGTYNVTWRNTPLATITSGSFTTVYLPISTMLTTRNTQIAINSEFAAYLTLFNDASIMVSQSGAAMKAFSFYAKDMSFGYDSARGTATTGNKYANMVVGNFESSHSASITSGTFFEKSAVKIEYKNTWQSIKVKPGITYHQLQGYSTLKIKVYFENSTNMQLYFQGVYGTRVPTQKDSEDNDVPHTGNQFYSYISNDEGVTHTAAGDTNPNGWYTFPANKWLTLELPIYQVKLKWFESGRTGDLADFIVRGKSFSAIYFADMWLE